PFGDCDQVFLNLHHRTSGGVRDGLKLLELLVQLDNEPRHVPEQPDGRRQPHVSHHDTRLDRDHVGATVIRDPGQDVAVLLTMVAILGYTSDAGILKAVRSLTTPHISVIAEGRPLTGRLVIPTP